MNKIIAFFLITIFSLNLLGPIVLFKVQQYEARCEAIKHIKNGVPDASLTRIFVKKENLKTLLWWGKDEFRYRGKMYDLIRAQVDHKGNVIYYCYNDSLESFLYSRLSKHIKNAKKTNKNRSLSAQFGIKYLSEKNSYTIVKGNILWNKNLKSFFNYTFFYNSPALDISAPPPKLV